MLMAVLKCDTPDGIMNLRETGNFLLGLTNDET